jgi:hypothetical protein
VCVLGPYAAHSLQLLQRNEQELARKKEESERLQSELRVAKFTITQLEEENAALSTPGHAKYASLFRAYE